MNDSITKLLMLQVGISGIDRVETAMLSMAKVMGANGNALNILKQQFEDIGPAAAFAIASLTATVSQAAKWQEATVRLEAFTHSSELAANQMEIIESIAAKGVFKFDDITKAVDKLDQMQISLKDNLDLVERLGARSGNLEQAADLVARIAGGRGQIPRLVNRLATVGITPEMLQNAGLNVHGSTIANSPAQILDALKKIEQMDPILNKLEGTFGAKFGGALFSFMKILQVLGGPALYALSAILTPVNYLLQGFIEINKWTKGWLGNLLGIILLMNQFEKIAAIWKLISGYIKLSAIWQAILNAYQKAMIVIKAVIAGVVLAYEILTNKIALAVAWQAIFDALSDNWGAIAAAVAVAAIVGIGWAVSSRAASGQIDPTHPSNRPNRRDDIENVYKKAYGRAWTG